jgi:hypothetical protein
MTCAAGTGGSLSVFARIIRGAGLAGGPVPAGRPEIRPRHPALFPATAAAGGDRSSLAFPQMCRQFFISDIAKQRIPAGGHPNPAARVGMPAEAG